MISNSLIRKLADIARETAARQFELLADCNRSIAQVIRGAEGQPADSQTIKIGPPLHVTSRTNLDSLNGRVPEQPQTTPSDLEGKSPSPSERSSEPDEEATTSKFWNFKTSEHGEQEGIDVDTICVVTFTNHPEYSYVTFECPNCAREGRVKKSAISDRQLKKMKASGARFVEQELPEEILEPHPATPMTEDDLIDLGLQVNAKGSDPVADALKYVDSPEPSSDH